MEGLLFYFIMVRTLTLRSAVLTHIKSRSTITVDAGCDTRGLWKLQFTDPETPIVDQEPSTHALFRVMTFMAFVKHSCHW